MSGPGYNQNLRSMPPFMWVERYERNGPYAVLAFGAYNVFGLIGPEKGGVALVIEEPNKAVIATTDIPYNPRERAKEFEKVASLLAESPRAWSPRKRKKRDQDVTNLIRYIVNSGKYDVR